MCYNSLYKILNEPLFNRSVYTFILTSGHKLWVVSKRIRFLNRIAALTYMRLKGSIHAI